MASRNITPAPGVHPLDAHAARTALNLMDARLDCYVEPALQVRAEGPCRAALAAWRIGKVADARDALRGLLAEPDAA
jgi:hypothetical protein